MRTTIDLDPEALKLAKAIAAQRHLSLGKLLSSLVMDRFRPPPGKRFQISEAGFLTVDVGRPITIDDVWASEEDE